MAYDVLWCDHQPVPYCPNVICLAGSMVVIKAYALSAWEEQQLLGTVGLLVEHQHRGGVITDDPPS